MTTTPPRTPCELIQQSREIHEFITQLDQIRETRRRTKIDAIENFLAHIIEMHENECRTLLKLRDHLTNELAGIEDQLNNPHRSP